MTIWPDKLTQIEMETALDEAFEAVGIGAESEPPRNGMNWVSWDAKWNTPTDPASVYRVSVCDPNGDRHVLMFLSREDAVRFATEARRRAGWSSSACSSHAATTLADAMQMLNDGAK